MVQTLTSVFPVIITRDGINTEKAIQSILIQMEDAMNVIQNEKAGTIKPELFYFSLKCKQRRKQ